MKRLFTGWMFLPFWASPNNSIYDLIFRSTDWSAQRRASALSPDIPREDPVQEPPPRPVRPLPTDVPVPEPNDVPVHGPQDVPPPKPGVVPNPAKPAPRQEPKPRHTP